MRIRLFRQFLQLESASGIILFMMAIIAMIWANSPLQIIHQRFIEASIFWINEGLMAVFFLVVGLELKRGFVEGQLSHRSQIMLPGIAALGGMVLPALIYIVINRANPVTIVGWATPVATDIAFALGVLSLFGRRIPSALKMFLLSLAIFDDLGAIILIALFYSHGISYLYLFEAAVLVFILYMLNQQKVYSLIPYLLIGILLWLCLLHSGIHPTIAGVLLALMIPDSRNKNESPLRRLEQKLHPWAAYLIMPLFALANAGFSLHGLSINVLKSTLVIGIVLGLFVGKQLGVFFLSWLMIKLRWAKLPTKTTWMELYGVSLLCGIGFTMSLFLGTLSFENQNGIYLAEVRLGVLIGSLLSGTMGALVLLSIFSFKNKK